MGYYSPVEDTTHRMRTIFIGVTDFPEFFIMEVTDQFFSWVNCDKYLGNISLQGHKRNKFDDVSENEVIFNGESLVRFIIQLSEKCETQPGL